MSDLLKANTKSFFERPEGKVGLAFIGVLTFAAFILFGNVILPLVISALTNTLHAMFLGGAVLGIVSLIMNDKFRFFVSNAFQSVMRNITGWFIAVDPIGILKNYIKVMERKIQNIELNISSLFGQVRNIQENIERCVKERDHNLRLSSAAKKQNKLEESELYRRKAARAEDSLNEFTKIYEKMSVLQKMLDRMKKSVSILLEDTKDEVRTKEIKYKSIKAAHKAMSGVNELITGSSEKELFEQAMEYIVEDISMKIGEMDRFMELSSSFLSGVDTQNGIWDEKGLLMLEQWESESQLLADKGEVKQLNSPNTNINTVKLITENNFDHLFKEN